MQLFIVLFIFLIDLFSTVDCAPTTTGTSASTSLKLCDEPETIVNAKISNNSKRDSYKVGSTIYYTCATGYGLVGDPRIHCIEAYGSHIWTVQKFSCVRNVCEKPEVPENGKIIGTEYSLGMLVTFECDLGYKMWSPVLEKDITVPPVRMCRIDGQWSGYTPVCNPVNCSPPNNISNGWYVAPPNLNHLSKVYYNCHVGYDLIGTRQRRCEETGELSGEEPRCILKPSTIAESTTLRPDGKKSGLWEKLRNFGRRILMKIAIMLHIKSAPAEEQN